VAVHRMGLALVAEETGGRGELELGAIFVATAERLEVGVYILAARHISKRSWYEREDDILIFALELLGLVTAALSLGEGAIVQAVIGGDGNVQRVVASRR
jgi:hypothetical protein